MRAKDTSDVLASAIAVAADAVAIFGGFILATWIRFNSGWIPLFHDRPPDRLYFMYGWGAAIATLLFLFLFRSLGLYVRPQTGSFSGKIPRLVRASGLGMLLSTALAFALRTDPPFSRLTVLLALATITLLLLIERFILFHAEIRFARRHRAQNRILILGTDDVAARLRQAVERDPRLRSTVIGFLSVRDNSTLDPAIPSDMLLGSLRELETLLTTHRPNQIILADTELSHHQTVELILLCERNLIAFNVVPDLFRVLTSDVDVRTVDDIPLLGVGQWPLDVFWNRALKRVEDVIGAFLGLILAAPLLALAAWLIKRESPGPAFYRQERCGENGRTFVLWKLRTMRTDAERETGPVWTKPDDPRRTRIGAFLRRWNLDELPQLWNVLKGDMSLVGPRPERPHFVEQFKEDITRYMWRHVSKPGMTGWAQVNGLRGNTSIEERIKYDLYYLEHWSLAFDFKILLRTLFARQNAY